MPDIFERSLALHREKRGKIGTALRVPIETQDDLALAYSPGVARPCEVIADDSEASRELTCRGNTIAVVTDGSAVLGLGDIGPTAAMPVMEGKAALFKAFADLDAVPLCIDGDEATVIDVVRALAPSFAGINLEDITAPRCFRVERALQDIGIPVFHDDQHGTAIVLLAALTNALRVVGKRMEDVRIVINGAGAAGAAIARILRDSDREADDDADCLDAGEVVLCDSKGLVSADRTDLDEEKRTLVEITNARGRSGSLRDALEGADVFIGVSVADVLERGDIGRMADDPIVLAMANPIPEIMPEEAKAGGAAVVATGRSDFPNQVNNVLCFPGMFRGAIEARVPRISDAMKVAAVRALADEVADPTAERILPHTHDKSVVPAVAKAVANAATNGG